MEKGIFTPNTSSSFNWVGASKTAQKSDKDISISRVSSSGKELVAITFRNHCSEILSDTEYLLLTEPIKNRIYFKSSNVHEGLLMASNKGSTNGNKYLRISRPEAAKPFFSMVGDYELKFDAFNDLYYIEKGEN